jgi:hypothetical protein
MNNLCDRIQHYDNFSVVRNVLSMDQIEMLMTHWNSVEIGQYITKNNWDVNSDKKTKIENSDRNVEIIGIPINKFYFLTEKLSDLFYCVIGDNLLEGPHYFTHYPIGGKHSPHFDYIKSFQRDKVISLVLNDGYLGGELEINGQYVPNESNIAIIYDGSLKHQVKSVTFGSRFVITECATKI